MFILPAVVVGDWLMLLLFLGTSEPKMLQMCSCEFLKEKETWLKSLGDWHMERLKIICLPF